MDSIYYKQIVKATQMEMN